MTDISYSRAHESDFQDFFSFFESSIPKLFPRYSPHMVDYLIHEDYSKEWLMERLKKKAKWLYLAKHNSTIVGYLLVSRPNAGITMGDWLAVDRDFQKRGIASTLLSLWEKDVLEYGGHNTYLWTYDYNVSFYEKRGFIKGGELKKGWGGEDAFLMYKILQEPKEENYLRHYLAKKKKA